MSDDTTARLVRSRITPGLPDRIRRSFAPLLLLFVTVGLAWIAQVAGWPREQGLATAILTATVLLWITEALPLFATAFISIAAQLLLLGNPGGWPWLGFEGRDGPAPREFLAAAVDPVLLLFFSGLVLARAATKTGVDRKIAAWVLRPMADTPGRLLLGVIVTTSCFSLFMSNTATAALMLTLGCSLQATALDQRLAALVPDDAGDVTRLAVLGFGTMVFGTFFSNTAIASMLMPVAVMAAGMSSGDLDLASYALTIALVASMSMALPVSTPPNAMAHATGELSTSDFVRTGGYIGVLGTVIIVVLLAVVRAVAGMRVGDSGCHARPLSSRSL